MSAFIVSPKHLNTIITFAARNKTYSFDGNGYRPISDDPQYFLDVLHTANVESVNERYDQGDVAVAIKYRAVNITPSPVAVLKLLACFDYQACEVDNYEFTPAARIINAIRKEAISQLAGYDDAKWSI